VREGIDLKTETRVVLSDDLLKKESSKG